MAYKHFFFRDCFRKFAVFKKAKTSLTLTFWPCVLFYFIFLPPSLSLTSLQAVSMEVSQPVPLQPSWHTQYQPLLPRVHLPFPLHRPGQPSVCVCDKIGGRWVGGEKEKKDKGQREMVSSGWLHCEWHGGEEGGGRGRGCKQTRGDNMDCLMGVFPLCVDSCSWSVATERGHF